MKSNMKRFLGIILAMLMVVTMVPVTAFADDATETASAAFVVDDKTYYLMPDSTTTYNGKTYVGVYANTKEIPYEDDKCPSSTSTKAERIVLKPDGNRTAGGKYVTVSMSYTNPTNIQDKISNFSSLGSYIIGSDYEWKMGSMYWLSTDASKTEIYFKGSVGLPTLNELKSLYQNDVAVNHDQGLATRTASDIGTPGGAFWQSMKNGGNNNIVYMRVLDENTGALTQFYSNTGSAWGYMTYVSTDFFKKTKLDVNSMGSVVKNYLATNFIQDDFAGLGYTADDFTAMGVVEVPANPTPAHSPNYFKVVANDGTIKEYLYNDTITQNGKTYIGLIGTTNLSDYGAGRIGIDMRSIQANGVDYEGEALPSDSNWYLSTSLTTSWANGTYKEIHNFMSWVPTAMQGYLLKYSWDCASNALFDNYRTHTLRTIGKLTVAGIDEIEKHATYLKSVASAYTSTGKEYIATRSGHGGYGFYRYTLSDGSREKSNTYQYPNGSAFMQMYVDVDMFKTVKLDVSSMRSNVKAMMKANFVRSDLEGIYSDAELDELGIESFTAAEKPAAVTGSSFVADTKTFYYLNNTIDVDGKKYFRIFDKKDVSCWGAADAHYLITERAEGGIYVTVRQGKLDGSNLQDHATNFGVFGDDIISSDYEWSYGKAMYNGSSTDVYLKGSINVPTPDDYKYVINQGVSLPAQGQMWITSEFFVNNNSTNRYDFYGNNQSNGALTYVADGNYWKGAYTPAYNYVTYVSEDYFVNNELDIATTGEVMLNAIKANFTREELAAGGWSEATLDALFDSGYAGTGLGIVAYKTGDASVAVVINNNDSAPSTGAKLVVVAAYSANGLEDVKLVPVTGTIPENSYTSKLPVTLETGDAVITEIKVMLWDSIDNIKPLAGVVTLD